MRYIGLPGSAHLIRPPSTPIKACCEWQCQPGRRRYATMSFGPDNPGADFPSTMRHFLAVGGNTKTTGPSSRHASQHPASFLPLFPVERSRAWGTTPRTVKLALFSYRMEKGGSEGPPCWPGSVAHDPLPPPPLLPPREAQRRKAL